MNQLMCSISSCPSPKVLDTESCKCICPDDYRNLCSNLEGFDENTCSCRCKNQESCLSHQSFNSATCQCEPRSPETKCYEEDASESCLLPRIWEKNSCRCVCPSDRKYLCSDMEELDESTCHCRCKNVEKCLPPKIFNSLSCQCELPAPKSQCYEVNDSHFCQSPKIWDVESCTCICPSDRKNLCSELEVFDENACHCRCKTMNCSPPKMLNSFTCQCDIPPKAKCYKESCPPPQVLDSKSCTCVCPNNRKNSCSNIKEFDEKTCSCRCKKVEKCLPPKTFNSASCHCELSPENECGDKSNSESCLSPRIWDNESVLHLLMSHLSYEFMFRSGRTWWEHLPLSMQKCGAMFITENI